MKHYQSVHRLPEYRSTLYTTTRGQKPIWQCRTKPRKGAAIIKSTRTTRLGEAVEFARKQYEAIAIAEKTGLSPKLDPRFRSVWIHFKTYHHETQRMTTGRLKTIGSHAEKYFCGYFGEMNVRNIHSSHYEAYKTWRREYWTSGPGVSEILERPNLRYARIPQPATLNQEHDAFNQILRWAWRSGYMASMPVPPLEGFKHRKGIPKTRGGGISQSQWATIVGRLKKRSCLDGEVGNIRPTHLHERRTLYFLVVFMGGTMIRPSEALRLRWEDVKWVQPRHDADQERAEHVEIRVSAAASKTKETRLAVGTNRAAAYLRLWRNISRHNTPKSFIFPRYNGERLATPNRTFKKVCAEVNVVRDQDGIPITLYSCRHYGITGALMRGLNLLDVAYYAGTSAYQIEKVYYRTS